eukprot:4728723-Alexandrium_andersonii.AAC.1
MRPRPVQQSWATDRNKATTSCVRSELELRGPRNGLELDPRSSRGVLSARMFALIRKLATKRCCSGAP